jgi:hypothetical protein
MATPEALNNHVGADGHAEPTSAIRMTARNIPIVGGGADHEPGAERVRPLIVQDSEHQ